MEQAAETFSFNGVEYSFNDVSDRAKYIIGHLNDLQTEESKIKRDLDKISVTSQAFSQLLSEELTPEETEETEQEVEEES